MRSKFIGFAQSNNIFQLVRTNPWEPLTISSIPYSPVTTPQGYMITAGSANLSLATNSPSGIPYISGIHIFRKELNLIGKIDVDWYFSGLPSSYSYPIYKETPLAHHLKPTDTILNSLNHEWQERITKELF